MAKVKLIRRGVTRGGSTIQYWYLRWVDSKARPRQKSIGRIPPPKTKPRKSKGEISPRAAEKQRAEFEQKIAGGVVPRDPPHKIRLSRFIQMHEQTRGGLVRPATVVEWRTVGKHAVEALGDPLLSSITITDAGRIRHHLEDRSEATKRKILLTLKGMLEWAVREDMLHRNPLAHVDLGAPHERPKRIFEPHEVTAMIDVSSLWWQALIRLAYTSGARRSELLHLRWEDVDTSDCIIRIEPRSAGRYAVSEEEDLPVLAWEPKTKGSARTIPLPPESVLVLLRLQAKSDGSPYLFLSRDRLQLLDGRQKAGKLNPTHELIHSFNRGFAEIQKAAAKKLKVRNWRTGCFHDLRKSFATRAAASGVPMHELQRHLGHSSITTTAKYYTDVEKSAADRLRKVFTGVA